MKIIINYKKPIFDDNSKITGFELFNRSIHQQGNLRKVWLDSVRRIGYLPSEI